tara:strand:- start:391 stop:534 length:144 start_codon:yes stop_codon:yes gene_type:complete
MISCFIFVDGYIPRVIALVANLTLSIVSSFLSLSFVLKSAALGSSFS